MNKIKIMNSLLANKIAAGEVIERCSSIVKELVENSIDAKSKIIKVSLVDGGIKGIRVTDDGVGMSKEDAIVSFERHATSKIYKEDDLFFIETLGFRGEALASIASVSEVNLNTSLGDIGTHIHLKGGIIDKVEDSSARKGTDIEVTNLFYNTPARLKFLKSENTELNHCIRFVEQIALANPNVSFSLMNNDHYVFKTSGSGELLKVIHEVYGISVSSNMLEIEGSNNDFEVSGYVSKPSVLRKNRNHMITFVNHRIVRNLEINKVINDAYYTYKHEGFYPITVININVDPTLVDVNIHPTKQDVKLSKMEDLKKLLYDIIKKSLYNNLLIPSGISYQETNINNNEKVGINDASGTQMSFELYNNDKKLDKEAVKNEKFKKLDLQIVGVVHGTYIICEDEEGMYIIDQHAAHERINYEKVLNKMKEEKISIKNMLIPINIELNVSDYEKIKDNLSILTDLGFEIEEFGLNTIIVKSHPSWIPKGYEEENIRAIIDLITTKSNNFNKEVFLDSIAKMTSCKMSIKANEKLSKLEVEQLLKDLMQCDNPYNCCHGRPLIVKFSNYDLETMFKRVI